MDPDKTTQRGAVQSGYTLFTTGASKIKQKTNSLSVSDIFCRLKIGSANSLYQDQAQCGSKTI